MAEYRWYAAELLLQSRVGAWDDDSRVDHQVRLIRAADAEAAYVRAFKLGRSDEHSYANDAGAVVAWEFLGLGNLVELDATPEDGLEVYSWFTPGPGGAAVRAKDQLTVFALARLGDKTVGELLDDDDA
jgi:Domain of unknown function (DUF4288)